MAQLIDSFPIHGGSPLSRHFGSYVSRLHRFSKNRITKFEIRIVCRTNFNVAIPDSNSTLPLHIHSDGVGGCRCDHSHRQGAEKTPMSVPVEHMTPLSAIVEAFEDLARIVERSNEDLRLKPFTDACALVSVLFESLGIAFKFAEYEYNVKVRSLAEASKKFSTLHNVLDTDVNSKTVKNPGSYSRNLRRVRQGIDLIRALFEQFLLTRESSLRNAASTAYSQTCGRYHTWAIRATVAAGMYALPTREQLLLRLNETDNSAEERMRSYIEASSPIIQYIDKLYTSRNIALDW